MAAVMTKYTFKMPRPQLFSFPSDVISCLWKNPLSPKGLLKLYKTCKYFYLKKRVLIVRFGGFDSRGVMGSEEPFYVQRSRKFNFIRLPLNILYWFVDRLSMSYINHIYSKNIYRCTVNELVLNCDAIISYNEFKILTMENTIDTFAMHCEASVQYSDGKPVPLDIILQNLPNLIKLIYYDDFGHYSLETLEKMNKLKFSNKYLYFSLRLYHVCDDFDPVLLCKFIKTNVKGGCGIYFESFSASARNAFFPFQLAVNQMFKTDDKNKPDIKLSSHF